MYFPLFDRNSWIVFHHYAGAVPFTVLLYSLAAMLALGGMYEIVDRGWWVEKAHRQGRDRTRELRRARAGLLSGAGAVLLVTLTLIFLAPEITETSPHASLIGGASGATALGYTLLAVAVVLALADAVLFMRIWRALRDGAADPQPNGVPTGLRIAYFTVITALGALTLTSAVVAALSRST